MSTVILAPAGPADQPPPAPADVALLRAAVAAPGGATALGLAWLLHHPVGWVYDVLDDDVESGAVVLTRTGRYQAAAPTPTVPALLAAAGAALHERGWCQHDYEDDAHQVDLLGALRLAAGAHPRELPDDPRTTVVLHGAEDALAGELARRAGQRHDPHRDDAGKRIAGWQDDPRRTLADVLALLADTAAPDLAGWSP